MEIKRKLLIPEQSEMGNSNISDINDLQGFIWETVMDSKDSLVYVAHLTN